MFIARFPEPPASKSGEKYASLESRCQACQVHGGDEAPCVSEIEMSLSQQETGEPCPYRPVACADDAALLTMVNLAISPGAGHLLHPAFDVLFGDYSAHRRRHRMTMVLSAVADKRIQKHLARREAPRNSTLAQVGGDR